MKIFIYIYYILMIICGVALGLYYLKYRDFIREKRYNGRILEEKEEKK